MIKMNLQFFGGRGSGSGKANGSGLIIDKDSSNFGKSGIYEVYRVGSVEGSDLGYISFGADKSYSQKYLQKEIHKGSQVERYEVTIKNPLTIEASSNTEAYNSVYRKLFGTDIPESIMSKRNGTLQRKISEKLSTTKHDSIIFNIRYTNFFDGSITNESEVLLLNKYRTNIRKK